MTRAMERLATGAKKLTSTWKPELGADDRDYSGNAIPRRWFMCGCSSTLGNQWLTRSEEAEDHNTGDWVGG